MSVDNARPRTGTSRHSLFDATLSRLTGAIAAGDWSDGDKLPSEVELAARLGVSRPLLREVLRELERAGRIVRRHGAGTFVTSPPRIETRLPTVITLEIAAAAVAAPVEEVRRSVELVTVGSEFSPLDLPEGETMWRIERLKTVGGRRAIVLIDYLPGSLVTAEGIAAELTTSVFDLVLAHAGVPEVSVSDVLEAETADAETAGLLAVPEGTPLMTLVKTVRRPDGALIQYGRSLHVASRFTFRVESSLPTEPAGCCCN
jgi:GntR family transcriptional regulator